MTETIVIYRLGSLGDTVVSLPCFHKIRERFLNCRRILLTNYPISSLAPPAESILLPGDFVHDVTEYPVGIRSIRQIIQLALKLRNMRSRTLIYLGGGRGVANNYRDILFFRLCGFSNIVGVPRNRSEDEGLVDLATGEVEREAARLTRCIASLGPVDLSDPGYWNLRLTPNELDVAADALAPLTRKPFITVNLGGKLAVQHWGEDNWANLLTRLGAKLDFPLVFVGAEAERALSDRLAKYWPLEVVNACGSLSPRETAALLGSAAAFVGHDTGPLHLAAAVGVPCVALFGSNNHPKKWHPVGEIHQIIHDIRGLSYISVEHVEEAVLCVMRRVKEKMSNLSARDAL